MQPQGAGRQGRLLLLSGTRCEGRTARQFAWTGPISGGRGRAQCSLDPRPGLSSMALCSHFQIHLRYLELLGSFHMAIYLSCVGLVNIINFLLQRGLELRWLKWPGRKRCSSRHSRTAIVCRVTLLFMCSSADTFTTFGKRMKNYVFQKNGQISVQEATFVHSTPYL